MSKPLKCTGCDGETNDPEGVCAGCKVLRQAGNPPPERRETVAKAVKCTKCDRTFKGQGFLNNHIARVHPKKAVKKKAVKKKAAKKARGNSIPLECADAHSALINLGYKKRESATALEAAIEAGHTGTEELVKQALRYFGGKPIEPMESHASPQLPVESHEIPKIPTPDHDIPDIPIEVLESSEPSGNSGPPHLQNPETRHALGQLMHSSDILDKVIKEIVESGEYETADLFDVRMRIGAVLRGDLAPKEPGRLVKEPVGA